MAYQGRTADACDHMSGGSCKDSRDLGGGHRSDYYGGRRYGGERGSGDRRLGSSYGGGYGGGYSGGYGGGSRRGVSRERAPRGSRRREGSWEDRSSYKSSGHGGGGGRFDGSSYSRSRERERRRRKVQAECIRRAGGYQKLADTEGKEPVRLFWDGFQWVAKTGHSTALQNDPALMNSTRKMRRLYFGNLPLHLGLTETNFQEIVWEEMKKRGFCNDKNENPVLCVWFAKDKGNYGFVEFASVEETERALMMDGMSCLGAALKVSRPNDYTTASSQQNQAMAFMGQQSAQSLLQVQHGITNPPPPPAEVSGPPSTLVRVEKMVCHADTEDAEELHEVRQDVAQGFREFGELSKMAIITANHKLPPNCNFEVGDVILMFSTATDAATCIARMHGRNYERRPIVMTKLLESQFSEMCQSIFINEPPLS